MQAVISAIEKFMCENGQLYREYYVGIACDPVDRLTSGHRAENVPNVYWNSPLPTQAVRAIERYFLDKGVCGGPGGGDASTCYIYAYKITPETRE